MEAGLTMGNDRGPHPSATKSRWLRVAGFALAALVLLAAAGCGNDDSGDGDGGSGDAAEQPQPGGEIVLGISDDPDALDPVNAQIGLNSLSILKAIYDPIAVLNTEGTAEPYLVESIESNDDFTEWTITMRDQDIYFHNGDLLTPQMLATHIKSMQLSALTSFTFEPIDAVGVVEEAATPAFERGELSEEEYNVQKRQVLVFMSEPWSTFPAFLAGYQVGYVAHPSFVDGTISEPVGTGPFVLEEWIQGDHVSTVKNDNYWREGLPYLNSLEIRVVPDPTSREQSLEAGDLDMMITNTTGQIAELATEGPPAGTVVIDAAGEGDEQMILLNTQTGPTSDLRIRQALQLATDRAAINDQLFGGYFELADGPFTADSFWHGEAGWPDPDPEAAAALVQEYEAENGDVALELKAYNTNDDLAIAQILQQMWGEAGIDVSVTTIDETTFATDVPFGDFEVAMAQFMSGSDPDELYPFWTPDNVGGPGELAINFTRYDEPSIGESLLAARSTDDPDVRKAEYEKIYEDWVESVPYLWLFHSRFVLVTSDTVRGLDSFTTPDDVPAVSFSFGSVFLTQAWLSG